MAVHPHRSKDAGEDWSEEERELWRQLFDSFLKAEATKDVETVLKGQKQVGWVFPEHIKMQGNKERH